MMRVEDEYLDILENIEAGIVTIYRWNPEMSDFDVMRMLEALMDSYVAEKIGRAPRDFRLSDLEQVLTAKVREMCEWRLGRAAAPGESEGGEGAEIEPKTVDEILLCLKRILKSVKMWNKDHGRQGYLDFVAQHV